LPCRNHDYSVKHTLEECDLIEHYFKGDYKAINMNSLFGSTGDERKKGCASQPERVPHDLQRTSSIRVQIPAKAHG
jgi:hypothetical protein